MTTPDDIVAVELARLSADFVARLPEELQAVQDGVSAWLDAPRDPQCFEILSHRVHQLKGSGSTFGCPGISRAARTLEQRLGAYRRGIDAGQSPPAEGVESAVQRLQNEVLCAQSRAPEANE